MTRGGADDFVPLGMPERAYAAAGGAKARLVVAGACWRAVDAFVARHAHF